MVDEVIQLLIEHKSPIERIIGMSRISWIYFERICCECPNKDDCPIEDLSVQSCAFLESRLPESLRLFLVRKRQALKRLREKQGS